MLSSETIWKKVMTKKTRRRYTAEFKAAAVARLDETGETLSSVAQALGVAQRQTAGRILPWDRTSPTVVRARPAPPRRRTEREGEEELEFESEY